MGFVTDKQDENTKSSKDQKNALDAAAGKGDKGGVKGLTEQIKAQKQALSELQNKQGQLTDSQVREEVQRQRKITQLEQIVAARKKELTLRVQQAQADTTAITGADYKSPDATGVSDTAADPRLMAEHALQSAISKTAQMNRNADAQARQANQNQVESHQQLGRAILQNALYQAQYAHSVQGAIKGVIKGLINAIIAYEIRNALQSASATGPAAFFSSAGFITAAVAAGKAVTSGLLNFETGGVLNGPSHARGGIPVMRRGLQIAEAQGNEAFINTKSTKMFYDELSAINAAGGGSRFPGAKPVVSGPASFAGGGVLKADLGKDYAARAMSSAGLVDSLRKALESANLVAPVELRRFSDEQNNEKSIQRAIGNKA